MKRGFVFAAFLALLATTGCIGVRTPATGLVYSKVKWDGETTGKPGVREGKACAQSILMLVANGDASIQTAAKNGDVTEVTAVDHEMTNIAGLVGTYCTVVRGN